MSIKINTALIDTQRTNALGSSNKIKCIKKTNEWAHEAICMVSDGDYYSRVSEKNWELFAYDSKEEANNEDYQADGVEPRFEADPLSQTTMLRKSYIRLLKRAIGLKANRVGNCNFMSDYLAAYLWQNPGDVINRIEVIEARDFDHAWVMINRNPKSSLKQPQNWGPAIVIDPWWKKNGVSYPASQFHEKIIDVLAYCIKQSEALAEVGFKLSESDDASVNLLEKYKSDLNDGKLEVRIRAQANIYPKTTPYPTSNGLNVEDMYEWVPYKNLRKLNYLKEMQEAKQSHQKRFAPSLMKIDIKRTPNLDIDMSI